MNKKAIIFISIFILTIIAIAIIVIFMRNSSLSPSNYYETGSFHNSTLFRKGYEITINSKELGHPER